MTESVLSGAPGAGKDVLEDDLSHREFRYLTHTDTPTITSELTAGSFR